MLSKLGQWPVDPVKARETGEMCTVKPTEVLRTIHGEQHPIPVNFFVSTDVGHVAEIHLPSGGYGPRSSDVLFHGSSAMLYILDGPVTIYTVDDRETYVVDKDEAIFLPADTKYHIINYEGKVVRLLLTVGPKL